jgi:hypothetical protein
MRKGLLFRIVLLLVAGTATKDASAGSAVAIEPQHYKMVTSYGHPEAVAIKRAMAQARQLYGAGVKVLAATDVTGYCAIGVARVGDRAIVAAALGQKSMIDAKSIVLEKLAKAGGASPKIISEWRG